MIRKDAMKGMTRGVLVSDLSGHKSEHASPLQNPPWLLIALRTKSTFYSLGIDTAPSLAPNDQVACRDVYWKEDSEGFRNGRKETQEGAALLQTQEGTALPHSSSSWQLPA